MLTHNSLTANIQEYTEEATSFDKIAHQESLVKQLQDRALQNRKVIEQLDKQLQDAQQRLSVPKPVTKL